MYIPKGVLLVLNVFINIRNDTYSMYVCVYVHDFLFIIINLTPSTYEYTYIIII